MTGNRRRRRTIILGSAAIALAALVIAGCVGGSYVVALNALHNHENLSVSQACAHWRRVYAATTGPALARLHDAVGWTLYRQLGCPR